MKLCRPLDSFLDSHEVEITHQPEEPPVECQCRVRPQLQSLHAGVPTVLLMSPQLQTPTQAEHSDVHTRQTPGQAEVTYFLSALTSDGFAFCLQTQTNSPPTLLLMQCLTRRWMCETKDLETQKIHIFQLTRCFLFT